MKFYPIYNETIGILGIQAITNYMFQNGKTKNASYGLVLSDMNCIVVNLHNVFRQYIGVKAFIFCLNDKTSIDFKANNWSIIFPLAPIMFWSYIIIDTYIKTNEIDKNTWDGLFVVFLLGIMFYLLQLSQYRQSRNNLMKELSNISNNEIFTQKI